MKTREEMIHYLGLTEDTYEEQGLSSTVDTAMEFQTKYDLGEDCGLSLECDFNSMPCVLEDFEKVKELIAIERCNGVVVYYKKAR